ncbi:hypothetical protein SAMN02745136_01364 [Anaerocolumna jejuensis DSM 15929]|uniref:Uncharacterized protein n=1 Tax=Anaerocolumna jejuensis DSM 15929 TaxID=1121322 RepID=A0A1M6NM69_9FIRM|nr:hypothetical protein SAMN02745136_01364 [Anaerocolumna jejuensis DSM 15929]
MLLDAENIEVFDCLFIVITKLILVPYANHQNQIKYKKQDIPLFTG